MIWVPKKRAKKIVSSPPDAPLFRFFVFYEGSLFTMTFKLAQVLAIASLFMRSNAKERVTSKLMVHVSLSVIPLKLVWLSFASDLFDLSWVPFSHTKMRFDPVKAFERFHLWMNFMSSRNFGGMEEV